MTPSRKLIFLLSLCVLAGACAGHTLPPPPPVSVTRVPPNPPEPNLAVTVYEVVETPEQDGPARTRIYIDNELVGQTEGGLKSQEKKWSGRVQEGNRLLRLERSTMPRVWDWVKAPDDRQPSERFVRVLPGIRTNVRLKFYDLGREHAVEVSQ